MPIDLTPFEKALKTLREALDEYQRNPSSELMRDGCIQRFEYCYAFATKMLRRHLETVSDEKAAIDQVAFPDLIRMAAEQGILRNSWDVWEKFRKARNQTSHTYDAKIAGEVMVAVPDFYEEAQALLIMLKQRNV